MSHRILGRDELLEKTCVAEIRGSDQEQYWLWHCWEKWDVRTPIMSPAFRSGFMAVPEGAVGSTLDAVLGESISSNI
jgi:hypothetical protein